MTDNELTIHGVRIDNYSYHDIVRTVTNFFKTHGQYLIVTLNPEFLLESRRNDQFRSIINRSALTVVDGSGISFVAWLYKKRVLCRFPGVDLVQMLIEQAVNIYQMPICIVTRKGGLCTWQMIKKTLIHQYPSATIIGGDYDTDTPISLNVDRCLLLCNFGAPQQETVLYSIIDREPDKHIIAVGVGGSFDYMAGVVKRAPKWMQKCGIEWLYRLYKQPHRWRRIINAVIIFPISVIGSKKE